MCVPHNRRQQDIFLQMANDRNIVNFEIPKENDPIEQQAASIELPLKSFERLQTSFDNHKTEEEYTEGEYAEDEYAGDEAEGDLDEEYAEDDEESAEDEEYVEDEEEFAENEEEFAEEAEELIEDEDESVEDGEEYIADGDEIAEESEGSVEEKEDFAEDEEESADNEEESVEEEEPEEEPEGFPEEDYEEQDDWEDEPEEEPVRPVQRRPAPQPKKRKSRAKRKKKKKTVLVLSILAAIFLAIIVMIVIGLGEMNSFKSHAKQMKEDLKSVVYCIKDDDFDGAEQAMNEVDSERIYLREKINDPFWTLVAKFPFFKSDLKAVNELLDIVDDACNRIVHPFIKQAQKHPLSDLKAEGGFNVSLINSYLDFAETIVPVVDEMAVRISSIEFGPISKGAVGDYTEKLESLIVTYEHFKQYIPLVEAFCGHGEDKFYIMMAQNSAEIRASGGYPGSMGTVKIENGVLEIGDFMSVYDLLPMGQAFDSGITDQEIELFGYMYAGEAHDACFNPHFARVGEITKASYEEYNEEYVDGVISLTPAVIQDILKFLDTSITLEDGSVLDGDTATRIIQRDLYIIYQGQEWAAGINNDYVDNLFSETAKQAMDILVSNFKLEKLPEYVKLFENGFQNRTIMLWLADPGEEKLVEAVGASGNLNNDNNDPKAGIYFSVCDPSKLGMFLEILPELSEPTTLADGSKEYTMTVTFNNYLNDYLEEYFINSYFVLGGYGGAIQSYIYFFAPAGGTVSDFEIDPWNWQEIMLDEYEGLEVGYILNLFLQPDEPVTITYKITTAPGVETPLSIDMTPTLQDYR